jgi:hypothetical protein
MLKRGRKFLVRRYEAYNAGRSDNLVEEARRVKAKDRFGKLVRELETLV